MCALDTDYVINEVYVSSLLLKGTALCVKPSSSRPVYLAEKNAPPPRGAWGKRLTVNTGQLPRKRGFLVRQHVDGTHVCVSGFLVRQHVDGTHVCDKLFVIMVSWMEHMFCVTNS